MKLTKTHKIIAAAILLVIIAFIFWPEEKVENLYGKVLKGDFKIEVNTSGELKAKKSEDIKGPSSLRSYGIWQIKITDLVTEGTYVKVGDYVGQLDKSEVGNKIIAAATEVDKFTSQYEQTRLDTAIEMMKIRDDLVNLKYDIEEKKLISEQSTYEAPAIQRQNEINLEKANRNYNQSFDSYKLKQRQNSAKIYQVKLSLQQQQGKLDRLEELIEELKITAPKAGMVVYKRDWDGKKVTSGSQISVWNPTVATLPDLSKMVTKTYVNEIDISKLKKDLKVSITVDAFADKFYSGKVVEVANVGEQLPNNDAKVFEVVIEINEKDTLLRPAMTTNNAILIDELKSVTFISQEAVFVNDSVSYVIINTALGLKRQKIKLGKSNDNYVVVLSGVKENEELLMVKPEDVESISWRE
jgi:multidrug efflux pump subunit AcrA (membrane-fusion protein)